MAAKTQYGILTYKTPDGPRAGLSVGGKVADIAKGARKAAYVSTQAILDDWKEAQPVLAALADKVAAGKAETKSLTSLKLLAPVPMPGAIYCAGANYSDHVARMAAKQGVKPDANPKEAGLKPWHFIKPSRTAIGHKEDISVVSGALDWEIELAAVIGRKAKNVSIEKALSYVAFYTVANDVSARDMGRRAGMADTSPFKWDWIGQKCFDGSCPMGPTMVPASQVGDPMNLKLQLFVNDQLKQNSNTSMMIFNIADQIAHLSTRMTLHPGDVICTGTPCGVGAEDGVFLKPGDVMRVEIENIGSLVNKVKSITSN